MGEYSHHDEANQQPLIFVISGPSGVGKDTVLNCLKDRRLPLYFVVTATTRQPRPNEQHGVDYFFVTMDEFQRMIRSGELLEYALVYEDYKGIPKGQVHQAFEEGKDVIMRIDVQGAATIRRLYPDAVLIFLNARNEDELIRRLKHRKSAETPEQLELRIQTAKEELKCLPLFDYEVINEDSQLGETVDDILAIIRAEHHRVRPRKVLT